MKQLPSVNSELDDELIDKIFKNHFDILKSKNSDFLFATFKKNNNDSTIFSPLSQSNYTNTIIKLINKVPKIYDYYCIINYNIIFEDINILDKIIEAIDRYSLS